MSDPNLPEEGHRPPWGLRWIVRWIVRWSERSLEPRNYWGQRYDDVLHERVDGFLSGVLVGIGIGWAAGIFVLVLEGIR